LQREQPALNTSIVLGIFSAPKPKPRSVVQGQMVFEECLQIHSNQVIALKFRLLPIPFTRKGLSTIGR